MRKHTFLHIASHSFIMIVFVPQGPCHHCLPRLTIFRWSKSPLVGNLGGFISHVHK